MDNQLTRQITASSLAQVLGLELIGADLAITSVAPLSALANGSLGFSTQPLEGLTQWAALICPQGSESGQGCVILSTNPRLDFARALIWLDTNGAIHRPSIEPNIHPTAIIGDNAVIGRGVVIGAYTRLGHHVVIGDGVQIGERCVIKSGAVIGEDGFGFERDEQGMPLRLVHLGSVMIGNDVEIGSLTTVCRGTLSDTVIDDHVKVDDHVHVAHNVTLRRGCMVIACAEVSGGVEVGEKAWIGPNASLIQKVKIGPEAFVGIAANVLRDVEPAATVAGNPAKILQKK